MHEARQALQEAETVTILTGAGVSTDSGIPDFRGPDGLWTKNPELEEMSNIDSFMNDPVIREKAWKLRVIGLTEGVAPNPAHYLLADYQNNSGKVLKLVTQNVDGLHLEAGSDPGHTIEIHGNINRARCTGCRLQLPVPVFDGDYEDPSCPSCFSLVKPDIVMFGEMMNANDFNAAMAAAATADILLCVGTSLQVYPIAEMAEVAKTVITVSNQPTSLDYMVKYSLVGEIRDILPELLS
jgi:NAD-dependent deacetylase